MKTRLKKGSCPVCESDLIVDFIRDDVGQRYHCNGSGITSCLFADGKTRMEKVGSIIGVTFKFATIFVLLYLGKFYESIH